MRLFYCPQEYSCGPAAIMLVLNHYFPEYPVTKDQLFRVWQRTATLPIRGGSVYALARVAQAAGVQTRVVVEDLAYRYPNYRNWGYSDEDIALAGYMEELHIRDARDAGVVIEERAIAFAEVEAEAKRAEPMIVRIDSGRLVGPDRPRAHLTVLRYEPDDGPYALYDPFRGTVFRFNQGELEDCITSLRARCNRDFRMILFSNPGGNTHA